MKKLGIYIHIPFCISKCRYCGFYSHGGSSREEQRAYVKSLIDDVIEYGKEYGENTVVDTIFIGGGTPSIIEEELIVQILDNIGDNFDVEEDAEITIECNPKTLNKAKLATYKKAGVNRLSIGLQSCDDELLRTIGRVHTASDFFDNYTLAREAGFENINVDLMFGLPGQTMEQWKNTLDKTISIKPEHISFYSLQLEEGTSFYNLYKNGEIDLVSDELDREMYHYAIKHLKDCGYNHYEISNAAKAGFECRHNIKYWEMQNYLGIGDNASSYIDGVRFKEAPNPDMYENSFADEISEFVFTGLRKTSGISLDVFHNRYGQDFWETFAPVKAEAQTYIDRGLLIEENGVLKLSEEGIDISNDIMAVFV